MAHTRPAISDQLVDASAYAALESFILRHFSPDDLHYLLRSILNLRGQQKVGLIEDLPDLDEGWTRTMVQTLYTQGLVTQNLMAALLEAVPWRGGELSDIAHKLRIEGFVALDERFARAGLDVQWERFSKPNYVIRRVAGQDVRAVIAEQLREQRASGGGSAWLAVRGGIGEGCSRAVYEYARTFRHEYAVVLFASLGLEALMGDLKVERQVLLDRVAKAARDAGAVNAPANADEAALQDEQVFRELGERLAGQGKRGLLVVEDCSSPGKMAASLSFAQGLDVVFVGPSGLEADRTLIMDSLTLKDAVELILRGDDEGRSWSRSSEHDATKIADKLGRHPLALSVVSSLLRFQRPKTILRWLDVGWPESEPAAPELAHMLTVLRLLRERSGLTPSPAEEETAWLVLRAFAWLVAESPIDSDILSELVRGIVDAGKKVSAEEPRWRAAFLPRSLDHLRRAGLLWFVDGHPCVHALVQTSTRQVNGTDPSTGDALRVLDGLARVAEERLDDGRWSDQVEDDHPAFAHLVSAALLVAAPESGLRLSVAHLRMARRVLCRLQMTDQLPLAWSLGEKLYERLRGLRSELNTEERQESFQIARLYQFVLYQMGSVPRWGAGVNEALAQKANSLLSELERAVEDAVENSKALAEIAYDRAGWLRRAGHYEEARDLASRAIALFEKTSPGQDPFPLCFYHLHLVDISRRHARHLEAAASRKLREEIQERLARVDAMVEGAPRDPPPSDKDLASYLYSSAVYWWEIYAVADHYDEDNRMPRHQLLNLVCDRLRRARQLHEQRSAGGSKVRHADVLRVLAERLYDRGDRDEALSCVDRAIDLEREVDAQGFRMALTLRARAQILLGALHNPSREDRERRAEQARIALNQTGELLDRLDWVQRGDATHQEHLLWKFDQPFLECFISPRKDLLRELRLRLEEIADVCGRYSLDLVMCAERLSIVENDFASPSMAS